MRCLALTPQQLRFAGDIAFNVDDARAAPDSDAMAVLLGDTVIGFYRLDYLPTVVSRRTLDRGTVALRAFALDVAWQGRGLGLPTLQACCTDIVLRRPERTTLALNVHASNTIALHLYRRAGFVDSGQTLPGGSAGPQRLLTRALGVGQSPA